MFLVRKPDSWPRPLAATVAMITLAVLDLAGAYAVKEAVTRRSGAYAAVGAVAFPFLFWVYACSLRYADLALVTLGWIVVLQVGPSATDGDGLPTQLTTPAAEVGHQDRGGTHDRGVDEHVHG